MADYLIDTNIMQVHGVSHLLTFNVDDFAGIGGIQVIDPACV